MNVSLITKNFTKKNCNDIVILVAKINCRNNSQGYHNDVHLFFTYCMRPKQSNYLFNSSNNNSNIFSCSQIKIPLEENVYGIAYQTAYA